MILFKNHYDTIFYQYLINHPAKIICKIINNLVQRQSLAVLRRTVVAACHRRRPLKDGRIATYIADHVEIWVAECTRNQLMFSVPTVEEQDDLALLKDWHDFIEELAGKRQL